MIGTYPVYIGGENCGTLEVTTEGLYTVFRADCRDTGEVTRISVYGDREGYLGVLMPKDGRAVLVKRLSKLRMTDFPQEIAMVCESGRSGLITQEKSETGETADTGEQEDVELVWYRDPGGALVTMRGDKKLVAIPEEASGIPASGVLEVREIEGRRYAVLEVKNGHIDTGM